MATLSYAATDTTTQPTTWLTSPTVLSTSNSGDSDGVLDSASEFEYLHLRLLSTDDQDDTLSVSVTVGGVTSTVSFTRSTSLVDGKYEYYASIAFPDADAAYEGTVGLAYSETATSIVNASVAYSQQGSDNPGGKKERWDVEFTNYVSSNNLLSGKIFF